MADLIHDFDVTIIGAGAAGLWCAAQAGQRGLRVLLIDHADKVAEKIRISGGGRANFTNRDLDVRAPERHYLSDNPRFCRSALSRFTPQDFIALLDAHGIAWHEKHKGQLFCDHSADDLIAMLLRECARAPACSGGAGSVAHWQPCRVQGIRFAANFDKDNAASQAKTGAGSYEINSDQGVIRSRRLVIATGGLSIPKIGATDFGYRIAQQFGHSIVALRPALVPLTFDEAAWAPFAALAGLSLPVEIATVRPEPVEGQRDKQASTGSARTGWAAGQTTAFSEDLLLTHRGLSGPAVLQISSYWVDGAPIRINLAPGHDVAQALLQGKARSRKRIANELATILPSRLADTWTQRDAAWQRPIHEASDKALNALADSLQRWQITPHGSEGYKKAEVTAGGVNTRELSSQTMESQKSPGLYFIGEVVDVTGWLGGYNFQWAWASAHACALAMAQQKALD